MTLISQLFSAFSQNPFDVSLDPHTFDVSRPTDALESDHPAHDDRQGTPYPIIRLSLSDEYDLSGPLEADTKPSLYERNCAAARALQDEIDEALSKLDEQLLAMDASHQRIVPRSLHKPAPRLSWADTATRWHYQIQAASSVTISTLGWGAIVTGLPYVASLLTDNIPVLATTWLGAGYLGANTLRNIPDKQSHQRASRLINAKLREIEPLQRRLTQLNQEETVRLHAMGRVITIFAERRQCLCRLEQKLEALTLAINAPASNPSLLRPTPWLSISNLPAAGLSAMAQTITRVIAILSSMIERYTTYQAELAYQQGEGKSVLAALATLPFGRSTSIVNDSYRSALAHYESASGLNMSQADVRRQLHMGENMVHALMSSVGATPGAVIFQGDRERVTVTSNLTTTRALAWYFDSAADQPPPADTSLAPIVKRAKDDSLLISDPNGKLYDFLMHAPTAYTHTMVNAIASVDDTQLGVFHIHDYYAGFPRGTRGVKFERNVDETGAFMLRMRLLKGDPVFGIAPNIIPVADKHHLANRITAANAQIVGRTPPETENYQGMPEEELRRVRDQVIDKIQRQIQLLEGEYKQRSQLENWENPCFHSQLA